ncbi:hypothetical protein NCC78_00475 [Micromonospora phytophila]|uniref:hypothetical protein n=1 Tax=Micromonospora phytophila TaxID=709888 RepID=UPI00202EB488|nr:hypothetical protein [Micromonospora phytophila]MCM0673210.1 hypothetical protein [Micromonospora phytophila]
MAGAAAPELRGGCPAGPADLHERQVAIKGVVLQVLAMVGLVFPLIAVWLMIAAAYATGTFRLVYARVLGDRSFVLARRRGLAAALRHACARHAGHSLPTHLVRMWHDAGYLAMVPWTGFMAGAALPAMLSLALPSKTRLLDAGLHAAAVSAGLAGAAFAVLIWVRGLGYLAHPQRHRRGPLPRLSFPAGTLVEGRLRIAFNAYLHAQTGRLAVLAFCYPWLLLFVATANLPALPPEESSDPPGLDISPLVGLGYMALFILPTALAVRATARALRRRQAVSTTAVAIAGLLAPEPPVRPELAERLVDGLPDPLGATRQRLSGVAEGLTEVARRVDARQRRGFTPHPVATSLRASAAAMQTHLLSERALARELPEPLTRVLTLTLGVLAGPARPELLTELAGAVAAFDDRGAPAVEPAAQQPGRLSTLLIRATTGLERAVLLLGGLATIIGLLLAVALTAIGASDPDSLVGHLLR